MGFLLTPLITCILTGKTDSFCVPGHEETKEIDTKNSETLQNYNAAQYFESCFKINSMLWRIFSTYTLTNEVQVIDGKIIKKMT